MIRRPFLASALLLAAAAVAVAQQHPQEPRISYTVDCREPASGTVTIEMRLEGIHEEEMTFGMPVWRPGSYQFQNYPERVRSLSAQDGEGRALEVLRPRRDLWSVRATAASPLVVTYTLSPGGRGDRGGEGLTTDHYGVDGPGTFLYARGWEHVPHRVRFYVPEGWQIATGMDPAESDGTTWYVARDYDTFVDCPFEIGRFRTHEFTHASTRYEVVVHGPPDYDADGLLETIRRIVAYQTGLFGGAPFERYVFIYHFWDRFGGYGLEHLNSTTIYYPAAVVARDPQAIASITAHEFFHAWNVKRIRPERLGPFDYSRDVRVRELWFSEGVTSYYAALTLYRTGIWDERRLFDHLAGQVVAQETNPARDTMSAEEASWTIWDEEREGGPRVDYYTKGQLIGWLLDLEMRRRTGGRVSLDDLMRFLYRWFVVGGRGPIGEGFREGDLRRAAEALTNSDFSAFFDRCVAGAGPLPYEEILRPAGLRIDLDLRERAYLGIELDGREVSRVTQGSPAERAGMRSGDEIVAIGDREVAAGEIPALLETLRAGEPVRLRVRGRDGSEREVPVVPEVRRSGRCTIRPDPDAPPQAAAVREGWLRKDE